MKFFKSCLLLLMCFMVFITSSGLTVNLHYCAGRLANVGFLENHAQCMMDRQERKTISINCESNFREKDSCCQNRKIVTKDDTQKIVSSSKDEIAFLKPFAFVNFYFIQFLSFSEQTAVRAKLEGILIPPLIKKNIYIFIQNFRN